MLAAGGALDPGGEVFAGERREVFWVVAGKRPPSPPAAGAALRPALRGRMATTPGEISTSSMLFQSSFDDEGPDAVAGAAPAGGAFEPGSANLEANFSCTIL